LLISEPITTLFAASAPGATPSLEGLGTDFRSQIQADVDEFVNARMRLRYPIPPSPWVAPPA